MAVGKINIIFRALLIIGLFYCFLSSSFAYANATLPELNQSTDSSRSYTFTANENVTLNENMGTTSSGLFSVIGVSKDSNSIIFNSYSGFVVSEIQTTLNLSDLTMKNALSAIGSVIYNTAQDSQITINNVNFNSNSVLSQTNAYGGAVYTIGKMTFTNSSFEGNYAVTQGDSSVAQGGAIYAQDSIQLIADSDNVVIVDNYVMDNNGQEDNAIYMANSDSTLTLSAQNQGTIYLYDNIDGASGYNVSLTGDGSGKIGLFGDINNANISISNVDITFADGETTSHTLNNLTIGNNVKFIMDIDLAEQKADTITSNNASGTVYLSELNVLSAPSGDSTTVQILKNADNLTLNIDQLSENLYTSVQPTMYSTSLLADSVSLGRTDTDNDSITINGWKDVLYEMVHDTTPTHMIKSFIFNSENEYVLTKDLGEIPQEIMLTVINDSNAEYGTLNANNHSMFQIKNPITSIELNDILVKNAKSSTDGSVVYLDNAASDFTANNSVITSNSSDRNGGAIYVQNGTLNLQNSTLSNNSAGENGGAIYITEDAQTEIINTDFVNNTAGQKGGAIYTNSRVTISADNGESTFEGNTAGGENNAIYANTDASVTLNATNNGAINMNDKISGSQNGYRLNVTGDSTGNVNINNTVENANITLSGSNLNLGKDNLLKGNNFNAQGGNLNLVNNEIGNTDFSRLTTSGRTNVAVDVDLANQAMDRVTADNYSNINGKINVNKMHLLSDATSKTTKILFADSPLKRSVTSSVKTVTYSRVYKYLVSYSPSSGYFTFNRGNGGGPDDFNPAILPSGIAQQVAYLNQLNNYQMAMYHSYTYMTIPKIDRIKAKRNAYAQNVYDNGYNPTYIGVPEEVKSIWVSPYSTFESIPLKKGPKVSSISYGTLFGGDSDYIDIGHGFGLVYGGYVGYNGNNFHYKGIDSNQQGAVIGATANIYKGNFYNTITANVGWMINNTDTPYGSDTMNIIMTGFADKIGYNFELIGGKLIIQPSVMMGYTFVSSTDYTSSDGVRINTEPLHVVHFIPGVRVIGNLANGWQPYALINVVCNFLDKTNVTADNIALPRMSVDPYVEYGIGIQKRWADKYSGFAQTTIRSGGRRGASILFGFRCMLGKLVQKTSNIVHKDPEKKTVKFKEKKEPNIQIVSNKQSKQPRKPKEKKERIAKRPSFNLISMLKEVKRKIFYRYNTDVSAKVVTDVYSDGVIISNVEGQKVDSKHKQANAIDYKDQDRIKDVDNIKPTVETVTEKVKTIKVTPKKTGSSDVEVKPAVQTKTEKKHEVKSVVQTKTEKKPDVKPVVQTKTEKKPEVKSVVQTKTEKKPEVKHVVQTKTEKKPEVKPAVKTETEKKPEVKPAVKTKTEKKPEVKSAVKTTTQAKTKQNVTTVKYGKPEDKKVENIQNKINSLSGQDKLIIVKPVPVKPAWVKPEVKDTIVLPKQEVQNLEVKSVVQSKGEEKTEVNNIKVQPEIKQSGEKTVLMNKVEQVPQKQKIEIKPEVKTVQEVSQKTVEQSVNKTDCIKRINAKINKNLHINQTQYKFRKAPKGFGDYNLDIIDFKF